MITKITRTYVRKYRDNGQHTIYVEWLDEKGQFGRTEGSVGANAIMNAHMKALLDMADQHGIKLEHEVW